MLPTRLPGLVLKASLKDSAELAELGTNTYVNHTCNFILFIFFIIFFWQIFSISCLKKNVLLFLRISLTLTQTQKIRQPYICQVSTYAVANLYRSSVHTKPL